MPRITLTVEQLADLKLLVEDEVKVPGPTMLTDGDALLAALDAADDFELDLERI